MAVQRARPAPDVFLASSKGLYYFDAHFDRGEGWYLGPLRRSGEFLARGEVSHSYLASLEAPERIARLNPAMRLLVCLREPVDRAFSDYLDLRKNQQYDGPFDDALDRYPRLLDRGRYATHLRRYLAVFPREQVLVQLFDDLKADPQAYADDGLRLPRRALAWSSRPRSCGAGCRRGFHAAGPRPPRRSRPPGWSSGWGCAGSAPG